MSIYRTLKPIAVSIDDVVHSYRAGIFVDLDDDVDGTDVLVARGRLELVDASANPDVELADEPASDEPKPLDKHTVPELLEIAKANGASEDSLKNLSKPKLLEAVERLTHVSED